MLGVSFMLSLKRQVMNSFYFRFKSKLNMNNMLPVNSGWYLYAKNTP